MNPLLNYLIKSKMTFTKKAVCTFIIVLSISLAVAQVIEKPYEKIAANAYGQLREKNYKQALTLYNQSFKEGNENCIDYYNAACCASLSDQKDQAFILLKKSIAQGYLDKNWASSDADLVSLRVDDRWTTIVAAFENLEKEIENHFYKIKSVGSTNLIPFKKNDFWGYVDRNSLRVIVRPVFRELTFMGSCTKVLYKDNTGIHIDSLGKIQKIDYPEREDLGDIGVVFEMASEDDLGPTPINKNDFKGFTLNEKNEITHFSDIYNRYTPKFFNISGPFLINGKYYAIAHKEKRSGVIDQEGNPLPSFDFVHAELVKNLEDAQENIWFYYNDDSGKGGFINEKGETKLAGELISYPFQSNMVFGFGIQSNEQLSGVLDRNKMEWVIKPQSRKITQIDYSYVGDCSRKGSKGYVALYFLIENGSNAYYIDKDLKEYRPK